MCVACDWLWLWSVSLWGCVGGWGLKLRGLASADTNESKAGLSTEVWGGKGRHRAPRERATEPGSKEAPSQPRGSSL